MRSFALFAVTFLAATAFAVEPPPPKAAAPVAGTVENSAEAAGAETGAKAAAVDAAGEAKAAPAADALDPAAAFETFCADWMDKLVQREEENATHIEWRQSEAGFKGSYTGYSPQHTCITKTGTDSTPVGRITYREITYEKQGSTISEAEVSPAHAVATIETTEIFRFGNGQWIY